MVIFHRFFVCLPEGISHGFCQATFRAWDMDQSGKLSKREFFSAPRRKGQKNMVLMGDGYMMVYW